MPQKSVDPLSLALKHAVLADEMLKRIREKALEMECFKNVLEKKKKETGNQNLTLEDVTKEELNFRGLVSRVRSFPSLMTSAGTVPALTFYFSKVDVNEDTLKELYFYFNGERGEPPEPKNCNDEMINEVSKKESAGYAVATTMLLSALNKLVGIRFNTNDFLNDITAKLADLLDENTKRFELEHFLNVYSTELKKLIDAYSKARWGGEEA